ncbi:DUF4132 domain-containing protein [Nocardioides sp. 503]|uniref:DUF4132 domain-containing protein n=1 Tax=Nocardioides sp. 503 TaxID=2508326 RepID=UPI0010705172|nr:DUF4132 domain-containing protein [Nocardioides sp. 503]
MLSGDVARAEMAKYAASESDRARGLRVHKLLAPRLATDIVSSLVDSRRPWRAVAQRLDELSLAKREKVLHAVSPELGGHLAYWWEWSTQEPYQRGWQRRAYRSPDKADSLAARWAELGQFLRHSVQYPQPLEWQAAWALHLGQYVPLGSLFASAIARGNREVLDVLVTSLQGHHDISGPSHSAFVALLSSPEPTGWAEVERFLVAAQRSEGLRQTILEAADVAHPEAFARILDVVVEHRLARFAGTVRALGVWIGEDLTVRHEKQVADAVVAIRDFLRQPPRPTALLDAEPVVAFLGAWSLAVRDVHAGITAADALLASPDDRTRLAAARLLSDVATPAAGEALARAVTDSSLPVYAAAVTAWPAHRYGSDDSRVPMPEPVRADLHARVRTLGKLQEVETGLIGTLPRKVGGTLAADILVCHSGGRPLDPTLVAAASADGRSIAAREYAKDPVAHRAALFSLVSDRSTAVRDTVSGALRSLPEVSDVEARLLEDALTRKASDLRTTSLTILRKQDARGLAASIERLAAGTAEQRRAADELGGAPARGNAAAQEIPAGLRFEVSDRTPAQRPAVLPASSWQHHHDRFRLAWTSLTGWLAEHADVEVQSHGGVELLANVRWIHAGKDGALPLPEILGPWWERIEPQLTDGGVELALLSYIPRVNRRWAVDVTRTVVGPVASELPKADVNALQWQAFRAIAQHARRDSWSEPVLQLLETAAAALPVDGLRGPAEVMERRGRRVEHDRWGNPLGTDERSAFAGLFSGRSEFVDPASLTDDQVARLWRALRFIDEPEGTIDRWNGPQVEVEARTWHGGAGGTVRVPDQPDRWPPPARILVEAFRRGAATRADVVDALVAAPIVTHGYSHAPRQDALRALTGLRPEPWAAHEQVHDIVADVRSAVIAAEVARGDLPGSLSETAHGLRTTYGARQLVQCLTALGRRPFARAYAWTPSRESSLSHLIRVNQPLADDTADELGRLAGDARIPDQRLIETAVYAPQWSRLMELRLGWDGLESAVWWVHAHTKDDSWSVDAEIRAQWATEVSQRTPLEPTDLVNGAADVRWFHDVVATLGEERFDQVLKAAKYASSSGGHKRADLFAQALLGRVDETAVVRRLRDKRHQDSVRALGLLPLEDQTALLRRYELLRGFVASDRTSGSQRRASESTAVEVGLENLARTAGFRDPQRLVWAMEAEAVRDLAEGPVTAVDGDLVVALSIDAAGAPELTVHRAGRPLKSVPAKSAKVPEVAQLRDRATSLRKQVRRMRSSLESACVLGDAFEPDELEDLLRHPILAPMLRDLVLVDDEGIVGLPRDGATLSAPDGTQRRAVGGLRVAHPVDLLSSGEWPDFQHDLMSAGRRQPFKQLFRELYTLNENERDEAGVSSHRYAGHQVEARRAGGIFTSRGWVADFEQGFSRTFHQQKLTAWCHLVNGWGSPTEVEDATMDDITFHPAGHWRPLPLADVPARVFSETMRDLDLVVSVAHASGLDPEASESSIDVRRRLVDETASMLDMTNVEVGGHHVRIKGRLGTYSVHLGSGVVHRIPGNAVCIVPVSAQHRGRVFLPFADDDPRTAELVAKVVLLARDDKIKDPTILQQLVG